MILLMHPDVESTDIELPVGSESERGDENLISYN